MKIQIMTLFTLLTIVSLGAAELQNMPTEIYQEIVANADTLADSAAVFSKLSQTSKQLKQQLNEALPTLINQLAQKYDVEKELVAFYFGIERVKQLFPAVLKDETKLDNLLETLLMTEKQPNTMKKMVELLLKSGAHFTRYQSRLINGDNVPTWRNGLYRENSSQDTFTVIPIEKYSNSQFYDFLIGLGFWRTIKDINMFTVKGKQFFRFFISHSTELVDNNLLLVDTDENFNVLSSRQLRLPEAIGDRQSFIALVTSRDGAHSSGIFEDQESFYIVSFDGRPIETITAEIERDNKKIKIVKIPWRRKSNLRFYRN